MGFYAPVRETLSNDALDCIYENEDAEVARKSGGTILREALEDVKIRIYETNPTRQTSHEREDEAASMVMHKRQQQTQVTDDLIRVSEIAATCELFSRKEAVIA